MSWLEKTKLKLYLYSPSYNNIDLEPSDNIIIKNTICKEELYKEIKVHYVY